MDRLQSMTIFVAVVDTGGFASAARKLALSPPVVTRAVAELEARLGLQLLQRTTRSVRVTDAGAGYADDCRRLLAEIDQAESAAMGVRAAPRGSLRVTAPVLFGELYVAPLVVRYLQQWPEVEASCLFVDRVVNLDEEGLDVAVRLGELPDSSLQALRVGQVRAVVVAAPSYLDAHGAPTTLDALAQHVLISATGVSPGWQWAFQVDGRTVQQPVRPRLRTTTNAAAMAAAAQGFGLARLLSYQVAAHVAAGRLRTVLDGFEPPPMPVHVVHREGRRATQKVRGFIDLAVAALRADPALQ